VVHEEGVGEGTFSSFLQVGAVWAGRVGCGRGEGRACGVCGLGRVGHVGVGRRRLALRGCSGVGRRKNRRAVAYNTPLICFRRLVLLAPSSRSPCALLFLLCKNQVRGSIPTFWTQETSVTMPKPPIVLNRIDPTYAATLRHFADLFERYSSPVLVLDLTKHAEKREREMIVSSEYVELYIQYIYSGVHIYI